MPEKLNELFVTEQRVNELFSYEIMDTDIEEQFQSIVELTSTLLDCPVALVSLLDDKRQWFKALVGIEERETPIEHAFCNHAIQGDEIFIIKDAKKDDRFKNNPFVTGDTNVRFYGGYPLKTSNNINIGTLCVID